MRMVSALQRIIEMLMPNKRLTIGQIQYRLRTDYGTPLHQKQITMIIEKNQDKIDVVLVKGEYLVGIVEKYRNYLMTNREY